MTPEPEPNRTPASLDEIVQPPLLTQIQPSLGNFFKLILARPSQPPSLFFTLLMLAPHMRRLEAHNLFFFFFFLYWPSIQFLSFLFFSPIVFILFRQRQWLPSFKLRKCHNAHEKAQITYTATTIMGHDTQQPHPQRWSRPPPSWHHVVDNNLRW